jgi:probable phosphoglycerate mutase
VAEPRLGELDYGAFDGEGFVEYARWLAANGPMAVPPGAQESQLAGIGRMMHGLQAVLTYPSPRMVVAHGLLLSVIRHTLDSPGVPLRDVFLPAAAPLAVVALSDDQLRAVTAERLDDLAQCGDNPAWVVDLRVFPSELRGRIATLDA